MKKVLITGITGFVGQHTAKHLLHLGNYQIIGTYRSESSLKRIDNLKEHVTLKHVDLNDEEAVKALIEETQPDHIYHLAAQASPQKSFKNPKDTIINNICAELHILEAIRQSQLKTRLLAVATGEMYGLVTQSDIPIDERTPLRPVSPYAVSKIAQDYLSLQYFYTYKIDVVRVRPFNHIGPGQHEGFVVSDFAKQIVEIEKKKREPIISVGNLEAKRDFTDVRDVVKAYALAMEEGESGEVYNIGSGTSYRINDMLQLLLKHSTAIVEIKVDPERFRPIDVPEIVCDTKKFHDKTGWKPETPFEQTIQEILDYWRKIV